MWPVLELDLQLSLAQNIAFNFVFLTCNFYFSYITQFNELTVGMFPVSRKTLPTPQR